MGSMDAPGYNAGRRRVTADPPIAPGRACYKPRRVRAGSYGNPRPPSWMTPDTCAGGLPGFDPRGFACNGDCSKAVRDAMNPKFSFGKGFSLRKIKIKF